MGNYNNITIDQLLGELEESINISEKMINEDDNTLEDLSKTIRELEARSKERRNTYARRREKLNELLNKL